MGDDDPRIEDIGEDRQAAARLLSKVPLEPLSIVLAATGWVVVERFLATVNAKAAGLIRDEMQRIGLPDPDALAEARRIVAEAMRERPKRPDRWATPMGRVLRQLWQLYDVEGPARADDAMALRQLGWALDRHRKRALGDIRLLFSDATVAALVNAIRDALDRGLADDRDLSMIARLPNLPVRRTSAVLREDHFSGQEFEREVEFAEILDLSGLRARASQPQ